MTQPSSRSGHRHGPQRRTDPQKGPLPEVSRVERDKALWTRTTNTSESVCKGETDLETERTCIGLAKGKGRGGTKLESDQEIGSTVLTVDEQQSFPL